MNFVHKEYMFVQFLKKKFLNSIKHMVFIMEMYCDFCEVET
jgi:hypothetical protein